MRTRQMIHRFAGLIAVAACCHLAPAAGPTDVAKFMPSDTAVYMGWTPWYQADSAELRSQRKFIDAGLKFATEKAGADNVGWVTALADAMLNMQTSSGGLGVFDVTVQNNVPDVQAALVVAAGADSDKFAKVVQEIATKCDAQTRFVERQVKGVALTALAVPDSPLQLLWGVHKDCFILALGETAAGKVIDCINGDAENLAANPEFQFLRKKVEAKLDARYICAYGDVQRIITRGKEVAAEVAGPLPPIVDQMIEQLGLTSLRSGYWQLDETDGKQRSMAFAHVDGPMRGLLKFWDQKPLTDDDLKIVPKDAYWAEVGNLDLSALWEETLRILGELSPEAQASVQGFMAMSVQVIGFSISDQLLPALGDTWALFDAPDHGGLLLTGTVLVADVRDAEALQGMLSRLVQMGGALGRQASNDLRVQLKETKHGEHTIYYVMGAGLPIPVAPAWGFVDNRWVFGLWPQTVAAAMKQVDPKTRGESILDHPDVKAARARLPKEMLGFGFTDTRYLTRLLYPLVNALQTAGVSMIAQGDLGMDLELMPPVAEAAAKMTSLVGMSSKDADGILYASIGDGAPVAGVVAGAALGTSVLLPSLSRSREVAKRAVSASNLRGIGQACFVYANDNQDKFPESFDVLLRDGFITRKMLQSPRNPDDEEISYVLVVGQTMNVDTRNVLAYERPIDQEGTNVLFADAHVEWMKMPDFKRVLQETYKRLGREQDLPAEFRN